MTNDEESIKKVVRKGDMHALAGDRADLRYWLSRPCAERIEQVERLRRQRYGTVRRMVRVARVVKPSSRGKLTTDTEASENEPQ